LQRVVQLENADFERFSVYGFSIDYPPVCRFEFNPKSKRERGDIVVHFPDKEKLFLSWGDLGTVQKNFATVKGQADHSIKAMMKSRNVGKVQRISNTSFEINSHVAAYNQVRFEELSVRGAFAKTKATKRLTYSLHLHCRESLRYFVIYALLSPNAPEDFEDLFTRMVKTFTCH
jgi:hypothetical protein